MFKSSAPQATVAALHLPLHQCLSRRRQTSEHIKSGHDATGLGAVVLTSLVGRALKLRSEKGEEIYMHDMVDVLNTRLLIVMWLLPRY